MTSEKMKQYVSDLMKRCDAGDVFAMEELATFYYEDNPELMDADKGHLVSELYEKAAVVGNQRACLNLGMICCDGLYT